MLPLSQVALVATHSPTQMYGLKFIKQKHSAIGSWAFFINQEWKQCLHSVVMVKY